MKIFRTKVKKIAGSDYHEVISDALKIYRDIKRKTKRKPYIRSAYFKNEKVFLDYFWGHLKGLSMNALLDRKLINFERKLLKATRL